MSDFTDMIKEALTGGAAFEPEPGRQALERAMQRFDRRARTTRWWAGISIVFMTLVAGWGLRQMMRAGEGDVRLIVHGVFLATIGFVSIGVVKLWFMLHHNHLTVMRELKGLEYLVLRDGDPKA